MTAASLRSFLQLCPENIYRFNYGLSGRAELQAKTQLGWVDARVRAYVTLRRHWLLIFCAFTFC